MKYERKEAKICSGCELTKDITDLILTAEFFGELVLWDFKGALHIFLYIYRLLVQEQLAQTDAPVRA